MTQQIDRENPRANGSGYLDEPAYQAVKVADGELKEQTERFYKLLHAIQDICDISDFQIIGRVTLRDKRSGKVWR